MSKSTSLKKQPAFRGGCIIAAALIVILSMLVTPPEGLTSEGLTMLAIVLGAMILFVSEAVPVAATCFMIIVVMKYTGVMSWKAIQQAACNSSLFFCMAGFGIGAALQNTNLAAVLLRFLYRLGKGESGKMVSAVVWLTAIISIFVSDGAAQIVVIAVVVGVINALGNPEPGTSRLAKALMVSIPIGAFTGGLFLPCSSAINVTIMGLSEAVAGVDMTFLQWALFGVPVGFVLTLFASWWLPKHYKPEALTTEQVKNVEALFDKIPGKLEKKDKWYLGITCAMVVLWFASNWITTIDTATVAMAGMFVMMLPGVDLLSGKDYKNNFSAMVAVTMLCIFPMASAMSKSGAGEWLVSLIFADANSWNILVVYAVAILASFMIHVLVPSGSANASLSATIIAPIMVGAGIPVSAAMVLIGVQACTNFMFANESSWQYTFGYGHYTFGDVLGHWPITISTFVVSIIMIPVLAMVCGGLGLV